MPWEAGAGGTVFTGCFFLGGTFCISLFGIPVVSGLEEGGGGSAELVFSGSLTFWGSQVPGPHPGGGTLGFISQSNKNAASSLIDFAVSMVFFTI